MSESLPAPVRVLVVDDYHDCADSLAMLLRMQGYDVLVAYGGQAALEAAVSYQPDVAFLDLGMPGMSGWEVARRLRHLGLRVAKLVALSAYDDPDDFGRSQAAGFDHHLVKPVDPARLLKLIAARPG